MAEEKFNIVEEEDITIFDESDDYVPGEVTVLDEDDELDVEYLLRETALQEAQQARKQKTQRWVSVGVVAAVVAFIAGVCCFSFRNII